MKRYSFYTYIVSNFQIRKQLTKFAIHIEKKMNIKSTLLVVVVSLCFCGVAYSQNNAVSNAINKQNISINNSEIKHSNSSAKDIIPLWKGWAVGFTFGLTQFDGDIRQHNHYPAG